MQISGNSQVKPKVILSISKRELTSDLFQARTRLSHNETGKAEELTGEFMLKISA